MSTHDDYLDPDQHLWPVELPDWWPDMEENCTAILKHYGALHWGEVYRQIYKGTVCGPTLGLACAGQDKPVFNAELRRYLADAPVVQLHVSSIVEGSDEETTPILVDLTKPGALERLRQAIAATDKTATDLYNAEFGDLRISRRNKFKRR